MKYIAYGTSKLLKMYLETKVNDSREFKYCIDNFSDEESIKDLKIFKEKKLLEEDKRNIMIVIFAVANTSLIKIEERLINMGFERNKNFIYYSDFFITDFNRKLIEASFEKITNANLLLATELNRNLTIPVHTTILGNALLLNLIDITKNITGSIAEVGAHRGGASKINMFKLLCNEDNRQYYLFDSFEGFPVLSENDPKSCKKGDYNISVPYEFVENEFITNNNFITIKGFVPDTFSEINVDETFSIVFYDCDLYQPALDTFSFFENKIEKGGYLVIHDYHAEKDGFEGVKEAVDTYFKDKNTVHSFFENTMAVIKF